MALKIRLARGGAKKRPYYRVVVAEARSPRDGRFVERVGSYNPLLDHGHPERLRLDQERCRYWLSQGAQPTERVALFFSKEGLLTGKQAAPTLTPDVRPQKSQPKKKAQERLKAAQAGA